MNATHVEAANLDRDTVTGFGEEWSVFTQDGLENEKLQQQFDGYFAIFDWSALAPNAEGFDMGCGSGRWAKLVAPRVGCLHCLDASPKALAVAKRNLHDLPNCTFHEASFEAIPLPDSSMDFGYCIGVLHHIPDTLGGIRACARKLKPGAPFLAYIYYAFDNRPLWYRAVWKVSDVMRRSISRMPFAVRLVLSQVIAIAVYYPLSKGSLFLGKLGMNVANFPLSDYATRPFYSMRTDALDRFGTRLEKRFSRNELIEIFREAGLENIAVSDRVPYWCIMGRMKHQHTRC